MQHTFTSMEETLSTHAYKSRYYLGMRYITIQLQQCYY